MTIGIGRQKFDSSLLATSGSSSFLGTASSIYGFNNSTNLPTGMTYTDFINNFGWNLLSDTTVNTSVSSIDVSTNINKYNRLLIMTSALRPAALSYPLVQFSQNSGSSFLNYNAHLVYNAPASVAEVRGTTAYANPNTSSTSSRLLVIDFENFGDIYNHCQIFTSESGAAAFMGYSQGVIETTSLINFVRISLSSGNIRGDLTSARVQVWGQGRNA